MPILHKAIEENAPQYITKFVERFPDSAFLWDENDRLPMYIALEQGLNWSTELVSIMNANISNLHARDPLTGLYPYVLAASEPSCDLRTMKYLAEKFPEQVSNGIAGPKRRKLN